MKKLQKNKKGFSLITWMCIAIIAAALLLLVYIFAQEKIELLKNGQDGTGQVTGISDGKYSLNVVDPPGIQDGFQVVYGEPGTSIDSVGETYGNYKAGDKVPIVFAKDKYGIVGEIKTKAQLRTQLLLYALVGAGIALVVAIWYKITSGKKNKYSAKS